MQATTAALVELGDHLRCERVTRVVLESTSDYWRPFYYLLEAAGLTVWLVNAAQAKVPGRPKSDKLDAVWLAKLTERTMVSPSLAPAEPMRQVRDLARARFDLVEDRTRVKQRIEKLLEDALIKISSVLTDVLGVSGRAIIEALIAGQRSPTALASWPRAVPAATGPPWNRPSRPVHRPPRPAGPHAAGPARRADRADQPGHRADRPRHQRAARPDPDHRFRSGRSHRWPSRGRRSSEAECISAVARLCEVPGGGPDPFARSWVRSAWT